MLHHALAYTNTSAVARHPVDGIHHAAIQRCVADHVCMALQSGIACSTLMRLSWALLDMQIPAAQAAANLLDMAHARVHIA